MEKHDVELILAATPRSKRKKVCCALIDHSRFLANGFMGYQHCARCGEKVADTMFSTTSADGMFDKKCQCEKCMEAIKTFTWKDYMLVPNKFIVGKRITA